MTNRIWLSSPHMGSNEMSYVQEAFDTNWIAPLGPHVTAFEKKLADYMGMPHALALSSGTAALHLALVLLNVKPGDYVICQSKTFSASANPIRYLGAEPVFIDSEPRTWNMDPDALRVCLEKFDHEGKLRRVKAIIPVDLYGMPAIMDEIAGIAEFYDIPVIEDAAEALGSTYQGRNCGQLSQLAVLSFNGNKIITSSGGGALISHNDSLIRKASYLSTQARDPAPHYEHSEIGYNYRLSNVLAGIGLGQMEVLEQRIEQRRANHTRYRNYFAKWKDHGLHVEFQEEQPGCFSNRWLTTILLDPARNNGLNREILRLALNAENIESRPLWKPMHLQPVFHDYYIVGGAVSERLFNNGLCLPSGSNLTEEDFNRIFAALDQVMLTYRRPRFAVVGRP